MRATQESDSPLFTTSEDEPEGAAIIHQDAEMYVELFNAGQHANMALTLSCIVTVPVTRGAIVVNGQHLTTGDPLKLSFENQLPIEGGEDAEILVFNLSQ